MEMSDEFHRVLPTGELLFNRFDKARYLNTGEDSSIYDSSIIMGDVKIGKNVWIGPNTILEGLNAPLVIGDYVSISAGVLIYTHDSTKHYVSGGKAPFLQGAVTIGSNTVIGSMAMIGCGVTIGNHCVIGALSMVTSNVPDYSIFGGIPAKSIGRVELIDDQVFFKYH
jgi:acetyltransferase-like isoleucine patch superfamily enzyme